MLYPKRELLKRQKNRKQTRSVFAEFPPRTPPHKSEAPPPLDLLWHGGRFLTGKHKLMPGQLIAVAVGTCKILASVGAANGRANVQTYGVVVKV